MMTEPATPTRDLFVKADRQWIMGKLAAAISGSGTPVEVYPCESFVDGECHYVEVGIQCRLWVSVKMMAVMTQDIPIVERGTN